MTKEDYMKFSKERLAELLVERDRTINIYHPIFELPCCTPGGVCINPQMDCINCPRTSSGGHYTTSTGTVKMVDKCNGCNNVKGCITCENGSEWAHYEEPVSEDLGEYINELSKQFPDVSFAKLSRIAVRAAKWQKEHLMDKACEWLADNYSKYIITNGLSTIFSATIDFDTIRMIEDFKKSNE